MDGYDASGNRVYDKVAGQTCHQCRQKTLGRHTACSECQTLHVRTPGRTYWTRAWPPVGYYTLQPSRLSRSRGPCAPAERGANSTRAVPPRPGPVWSRGGGARRASSAATACSCATARTSRSWGRAGSARPAAACATAASTASAAAGRPRARCTAARWPRVRARAPARPLEGRGRRPPCLAWQRLTCGSVPGVA